MDFSKLTDNYIYVIFLIIVCIIIFYNIIVLGETLFKSIYMKYGAIKNIITTPMA